MLISQHPTPNGERPIATSHGATEPRRNIDPGLLRASVARCWDGTVHQRSTSPNTGSTEPMIVTTSATLWPGITCGSTARLEKDAPRHFIRYGFALPSEIM